MLVDLPNNLHYPFLIKRIDKQVGEQVRIRDSLFLYSYSAKVKEQRSRYDDEEIEVTKTQFASFESPIDGTVGKWLFWEGDEVDGPRSILEIVEECKHSVVFNGMCTECGKDMTGFDVVENAHVQAAHDTDKLLISQEEAADADEQAKKRLLAARKLSLVVDLDQTVIHAAVDPTIGEWQNDPDNPNYDALKDVRKFQLSDDGRGFAGCWYYIKLRPGLEQFLDSISEKYELHIYTMGTRQYAQQIASIVDPDRKYFDDRILSRDESGSILAKNLTRLFPVDTKMVVIIDDRADVWRWSPNLVRVSAFDFFTGVGDINAGFLPQKQELQSTPADKPPKAQEETGSSQNGHPEVGQTPQTNGDTPDDEKMQTDTTALQQVVAMTASDRAPGDMADAQEKVIADQLEEKPLLKLQQKMDEKDGVDTNAQPELALRETESDSSDSESSSSAKAKRHSVLRNDDEELLHLERSLRAVHDRFFVDYDRKRGTGKGGRVALLAGKGKAPLPEPQKSDLDFVPDIKQIMPAMKARVLQGVVIVFSGVLPLNTDIRSADIYIWAQSFGARVVEKVSREVTHVIAARVGTAKVKSAVRRGIKVVSTQWLMQSIQRWKKLDEKPYLLKDIGQKELEGDPTRMSLEQDSSFLDENALAVSPDLKLSSEEDNSGVNETDDTEEEQLKREKAKSELNPAFDTTYDPNTNLDGGARHELTSEELQRMDADLAEFMGSDVESESDAESVKSDRSTLSRRPKKRPRDDDDGGDGDRGSDSDGDNRDSSHKRQRQNGGSRLKAMTKVESSNENTPAAQLQEEDDEDDEELARELERELEAIEAEED